MITISFQVYFIALACSDSVALLSWGVARILGSGPQIIIKKVPKLCHIYDFLVDLSMSSSAWYIMYVTVERALIVLLPLKAKQISTAKNARRAVITITVTMVIVMSQDLWMADWFSMKKDYLKAFQGFYAIKKTYVRVMYAFLPAIVTCLFYLILLIKITVAKFRKSQQQNQPKSKLDTFAKSILVVFTTYFVFTAPYIILIIANLSYPGWRMTSFVFVTIIEQIVSILRVLNYSSNFVIYWFTNMLFQKETVKMLRRKTQVNPLNSHNVAENRM